MSAADLDYLWNVLERYDNPELRDPSEITVALGRAIWQREMTLLLEGRKRIRLTEMIAPLQEQPARALIKEFESQGLSVHTPDRYEFYLAVDPKNLQVWRRHGLSCQDWSHGHPYLAGWMLGYHTGAITAYYQSLPAGALAVALEQDYDIYRNEFEAEPPGGKNGPALLATERYGAGTTLQLYGYTL